MQCTHTLFPHPHSQFLVPCAPCYAGWLTAAAALQVGLGDKVAPTDVEEGMRVGVDRTKYQVRRAGYPYSHSWVSVSGAREILFS